MPEWVFDFHHISIQFDDKIIRIKTDYHLKAFLEEPGNGSLQLADYILENYQKLHNVPLAITRDSLAIEILAHTYVDSFSVLLSAWCRSRKNQIYKKALALLEKVRFHTDIIDCGESAVDNNRFIWDALAPHHKAIYAVCGDHA